MAPLSKEEVEKIESDLAYWAELERAIPTWRVFGFSYRMNASIDTGSFTVLQLTGSQRDDILNAIKGTQKSDERLREVIVDVMLNDGPDDTVYDIADRVVARRADITSDQDGPLIGYGISRGDTGQ